MMADGRPILLATRGSALALAQAHQVIGQCRAAFPKLAFDIKILKTTGDKLQETRPDAGGLPKGLFTRELEVALLKGQADLAVHSLKDLPTELPAGLILGAVGKRADVREVLVYRDAEYLSQIAAAAADVLTEWSPGHSQRRGYSPQASLSTLPQGWTIATGSPRRQAQIRALRADLRVVPIRGNVPTRLQKLCDDPELDALLLAAAGMERLHFEISASGQLKGDAVPDGLLAVRLPLEVMLPCVGQGAVGIEVRQDDGRIGVLCERLNHYNTRQAVEAERALLRAMGGGCQSPVAAFAEVVAGRLKMSAVSFLHGAARQAQGAGPLAEPAALGESLAAQLQGEAAS